MQKCHGTFFKDNAPHLGATPLAYAAAFGLKTVFETLFLSKGEHGLEKGGG